MGVCEHQRQTVGLSRLPFTWSADGNRDREAIVVDLYRPDNTIRGTVLANVAEDRGNLTGTERKFAIRCDCWRRCPVG
jgi:hypothetical protein